MGFIKYIENKNSHLREQISKTKDMELKRELEKRIINIGVIIK